MTGSARAADRADRATRLSAVRPPTLRDVAQRAGVHPATASRALNPQTRNLVNEETANRVIKVAEQLGYRPNPIARSLKTGGFKTICFIADHGGTLTVGPSRWGGPSSGAGCCGTCRRSTTAIRRSCSTPPTRSATRSAA